MPSNASNADKYDLRIECPIAKLDEPLRVVTGIVLEPDEVDSQNDTISSEEIRRAAHNYLASYNRETRLGLQHKVFDKIGLELVESWIAPVDLQLGGESVKAGSWVMSVHVLDDGLWEAVKAGKFTGFSIGGVATVIGEGK